MDVNVYNQNLESVGSIGLSDRVFNVPMNKDLLFQVTTSQMSNQRQVIAHAKGRSEVSGGGKKPWKQKGTGRARHGSIRSPIWKGGGVTHGPTKERNFKKKINAKMAKKATAIVLSSKLKDDQLRIIDEIKFETPKTKAMHKILTSVATLFKDAKKTSSMLLIIPAQDENIKRTAKNLPKVNIIEARNINALTLLSSKYIIMLKNSAEVIEKNLG